MGQLKEPVNGLETIDVLEKKAEKVARDVEEEAAKEEVAKRENLAKDAEEKAAKKEAAKRENPAKDAEEEVAKKEAAKKEVAEDTEEEEAARDVLKVPDVLNLVRHAEKAAKDAEE